MSGNYNNKKSAAEFEAHLQDIGEDIRVFLPGASCIFRLNGERQGEPVTFSDGFARMMGGSVDDMFVHYPDHFSMACPKDYERVLAVYHSQPDKGVVDLRVLDLKNNELWVSVNYRTFEYSGIKYLSLLMTDISALKEQEAELRNYVEADKIIIRSFSTLQKDRPLMDNLRDVMEDIMTYMNAFDVRILLKNNEGFFKKRYGYLKERIVGGNLKKDGLTLENIEPWLEVFKRNECVRIDSPEDIKDTMPDYYKVMVEENAHNVIIVPLMNEGDLIGYFGLLNPKYDKYGQVQGTLMSLSSSISNAIINDRNLRTIYESNERLARHLGEYYQELNFFRAVRHDASFRARCDLDANRVIETYPELPEKAIEGLSYDEISDLGEDMNNYDDNGVRVGDFLSRKHLMEEYDAGHRTVSITCRRENVRDLEWVQCEARMFQVPDSGHIEVFIYTFNVTGRILANKMAQQMLNSILDISAIINLNDGTIRYFTTESFESESNVTIVPFQVALEQDIRDNILPEDIASYRYEANIPHLVDELTKNDTYEYTVRYKTQPDGTTPRKLVKYSWIDDSHDAILACVTDTTAQYMQEQDMLGKMEEALEAAEAANNAKTEFLSRISHDIRTPIGAILNLTDYARKDINNPDKLENDLDKIATSGRFLLSLINDVLDIAKINSGKIELQLAPYAFEEYAREIRNIIEPMCEEKGLAFEFETQTPAVLAAYTDKVRINQLTLNLLSNAVKYTPSGGNVRFEAWDIRKDESTVEFHMVVEDNGIGMSSEFQQVMFEEFAQEMNNPYRSDVKTGTGLGLPIVKKLIDLMEGTIEIDSRLGEGTRIEVSVPLVIVSNVDIELGKLAVRDGWDGQEQLQGRILFAEDNEINSEIALRMFEDMGITVDHVWNGKEAVRKYRESDHGYYQMIFMDIQMPEMNGYEATEAIRALTGRPDAGSVPIVAMTADAFADAMIKAENAGMTAYLTKPFDEQKIWKILKEYLKNPK